jgi:tryptophan synthase alpha chain
MNRIERIFAELRTRSGKGLMPFVCGGYPGAGSTAAVLPALDRAGAAVVEVGIPFSDPIADGPVISAAMHQALEDGATIDSVFGEVASVRGTVALGLVAMCSISIIYRAGGPTGFVRRAATAGFDGLIVPDVVLEESAELRTAAADAGLTLSLLVAPSTPLERAAAIAAASTGFLYLLSRSGITGESSGAPDVGKRVASLRLCTSLPIACGFGISTAEQVRAVLHPPDGSGADAAIVGSALVRRMGEAARAGQDPAAAASRLVEELSVGVRTSGRV